MTLLGQILSSADLRTEEFAPVLNGYVEATALTTTAAALEDMTGLTFNLTTTVTGMIHAELTVECESSGGGADATGAWAISINAVDGTEIARFLSGTNDVGAVSVQTRSASLVAGTYTIKGRWRRSAGAKTVSAVNAQLSAMFVAETPLFYYADGTFTRASAATWWDGTILTRYGVNVLRQPVEINGRPAFALEGARTNYVIESDDIANTGGGPDQWSNALALATITGPDGVANSAQTYTSLGGGESIIYYHDDTVMPDSTTMVGSALLKGAGGQQFMQLRDKAGALGALTAAGGNGAWGKGAITLDSGIGAIDPYLKIQEPTTTAGAHGVSGVQLERAAFASSLVETAGAAATRPTDDLTIASTPAVFREGKWFVEMKMGLSSAEMLAEGAVVAYVFNISATEHVAFITAVQKLRYRTPNGFKDTNVLTWAAGDVVRITIDHAAGTLTVSGFAVGDGTYSVAVPGTWANTALIVGSKNGVTQALFSLLTEPYAA